MSVRHVLFSTVDNLVKKNPTKHTSSILQSVFVLDLNTSKKCDKDDAPTFDKNTCSRQHFIGLKQRNMPLYKVIFKNAMARKQKSSIHVLNSIQNRYQYSVVNM